MVQLGQDQLITGLEFEGRGKIVQELGGGNSDTDLDSGSVYVQHHQIKSRIPRLVQH